MFQDEAGFGRINKPKRCWAPQGIRPCVPCHHIREYRYAYGAVEPLTGEAFFLVLPWAKTDCMNIFLAELSHFFPEDLILLATDQASWHTTKKLFVPDNIQLFYLPPCTPEMNPIALTQEGLPLGVLHQEYHTRKEKKQHGSTKEQRQFRPIEEKESYQWLNSMKESRKGIPETVTLIHIYDREGDIYELFDMADKEKEIFLVRILHNRLTVDSKRVMDELEQKELKGTLFVRIARNPKEHTPSRTVLMNFTYGEYDIKRPNRRKESHVSKNLRVNGIYVCESGKPKNKAIHWFLLTNDSIENNDKAVELIKNYTQRWKI